MNELSTLLQAATQQVPEQYFKIAIDGGDPIYRERVYCYELYHQLRCLWPSTTEYYLNGELDKAAHPILSDLGASGVKPDLLVHKPGYMSGNHAMIEVKTCLAETSGIAKDLRNLALFKTKVGYERAVYLIFGYEAEAKVAQVRKVASAIGELPKIELWIHQQPKQAATYEGDA